jgi:uncharacterized protein YbdZ (MbtH family)
MKEHTINQQHEVLVLVNNLLNMEEQLSIKKKKKKKIPAGEKIIP